MANSEPDLEIAAEQLIGRPEQVEARLALLCTRVDKLIAQRWAEVEAVVRALLERKTLSGDELLEVVQTNRLEPI